METFNTFTQAQEAAEQYFAEAYNYTSGVGVESAERSRVEFYSKDDPGMDDTFTCIINDGSEYYCKNGGQLRTVRL